MKNELIGSELLSFLILLYFNVICYCVMVLFTCSLTFCYLRDGSEWPKIIARILILKEHVWTCQLALFRFNCYWFGASIFSRSTYKVKLHTLNPKMTNLTLLCHYLFCVLYRSWWSGKQKERFVFEFELLLKNEEVEECVPINFLQLDVIILQIPNGKIQFH